MIGTKASDGQYPPKGEPSPFLSWLQFTNIFLLSSPLLPFYVLKSTYTEFDNIPHSRGGLRGMHLTQYLNLGLALILVSWTSLPFNQGNCPNSIEGTRTSFPCLFFL